MKLGGISFGCSDLGCWSGRVKLAAGVATVLTVGSGILVGGYVFYRVAVKAPKKLLRDQFDPCTSSKGEAEVIRLTHGPRLSPAQLTYPESDKNGSKSKPTLGTKENSYDYIVIGAGIGGLTAASMMAQQGMKVLVLEQHDRLGGATHCFDSLRPTVKGGQILPGARSINGHAAGADNEDEEPVVAGEGSSNKATKCEFDTGYHYTCASFSKPHSRPGGFLRYASGGALDFSELGDPYDRLMFPHHEGCRENKIGDTEYHFVKEDEPYVATLVKQMQCKHPKAEEALKRKVALFHKQCHQTAHKACALFMARCADPNCFSRYIPPFCWIRNHLLRAEKSAARKIDFCGTISTAMALKLVLGAEEMSLAKSPHKNTVQSLLSHGEETASHFSKEFEIDGAVGKKSQAPSSSELQEWEIEVQEKLPRLMAILTHPLGDYAAQPRDSSFLAHSFVVNYYRHGSSYPMGSAQALSAGFAQRIREAGGKCLTQARVTQLLFDDSKKGKMPRVVGVEVCSATSSQQGGKPASDADLVKVYAKHGVVNAAGIFHAYRDGGFLDRRSSDSSAGRQVTPNDPVETARQKFLSTVKFQPSMGHIYLFVTLDGTPDELNLEKTNLWCFQGKGPKNNDIDGAYDDFLGSLRTNNDSASHKRARSGVEGGSANGDNGEDLTAFMDNEPPTVYITFPCAKSPEQWAKSESGSKGLSNCIVFCDADYRWFEQYKDEKPHYRDAMYNQIKEKFAKHLLGTLFEKRPDLRSKVLWYEVGSPASSEYYLGAFRGGDYGTRVDTKYFSKEGCEYLIRADTPFPGLYQAGQDAMTPSISGAMHGGVLCAYYALGPCKGMIGITLDVMNVQFAALRGNGGAQKTKRPSRFSAFKSVLYNFLIEGDL